MYTQGVDPQLDFSNINEVASVSSTATSLPSIRATPTAATSCSPPSRARTRTRSRRASPRSKPEQPGRCPTCRSTRRTSAALRGDHPRQQPVRARAASPTSEARLRPRHAAAPAADRVRRPHHRAGPRSPGRASSRGQGDVQRQAGTVSGRGNGPIAGYVDALGKQLRRRDHGSATTTSTPPAPARTPRPSPTSRRETPSGKVLWGVGMDPTSCRLAQGRDLRRQPRRSAQIAVPPLSGGR
jgi:hypothetical protein